MDGQIELEILRNHWQRHVFQRVLTGWMNKDKQMFTENECRDINDLFVDAQAILRGLNVNSRMEFAIFLQKMNQIVALMSKDEY